MDGHFRCSNCGAEHDSDARAHRCPRCSGPLAWQAHAAARFPRLCGRGPVTASGAGAGQRQDAPGVWRYADALPALAPVSLHEPVTPLVPLQDVPPELQGLRVLAKCEYALPTGSYKDRGSSVLTSWLRQLGVPEAVEDSSGNAGASLAAYAARAGIPLKVFCPASASAGKLVQIRLYGAQLVRVEGPRPRATVALLEYLQQGPATYASHLWNPLFLEGVKTLAFELVEQLAGAAPDWVVCPVGAGSILLGLSQGFAELRQAGVIPSVPRLAAVQAEAVSPVCRALAAGAADVEPAGAARPTLAEGIALPGPVRGRQVLQALRDSQGTAVAVSEAEIAAAVLTLGRAGLCVEPTSAVVWPGLVRLRQQGLCVADQTVVLVLSGSGLKAAAALGQLLG